MRVTSLTTVAAPIDTVWDALSNHSGISRWAPGLTVTMDRLGTADPNGVGAIRRIASRARDRTSSRKSSRSSPHICSGIRPVRNTLSGVRRRGTAVRSGCGYPHQLHHFLHRKLPAGQGAPRDAVSGVAPPARARVREAKLRSDLDAVLRSTVTCSSTSKFRRLCDHDARPCRRRRTRVGGPRARGPDTRKSSSR